MIHLNFSVNQFIQFDPIFFIKILQLDDLNDVNKKTFFLNLFDFLNFIHQILLHNVFKFRNS